MGDGERALPEVLALLGPTAAGKSGLAVEVARRRTAAGRHTEIVAVDAFTVYRGMDVGTAKPSAAVRAEVPHHLVDVLEPADELTVAAFQRLARTAVEALRARGVSPLLVGGSGLYWRAVVDDLAFPPTDAAVRSRLELRYADDPAAAHAALARLDPTAAEGIAPQNLRRSVRALEVIELTGVPFSHFGDAWQRYEPRYEPLETAYLEPAADVLRARIGERAAAMLDAGLLDEAAALRAETALSRTAQQAIGYAEAFAVLDGAAPRDGLAERIAARTWRYARRQRSWFRRDPRCVPTDADEVRRRWTDR